MSDYANKLALLSSKKQKLIDQESQLIAERKKEIGELAEKYGLLTVSDELITGLFSDVADALKNKDDRLKQWETLGGRFRGNKKSNTQAAQETSRATS